MEAEEGWEGDRHVAEANYFPEQSVPQTDTQTRGCVEFWFGKAWYGYEARGNGRDRCSATTHECTTANRWNQPISPAQLVSG